MSLPGKLLIKILERFSFVKGLQNRIHEYEKYSCFDPGHYYSALADPAEFLYHKKNFPVAPALDHILPGAEEQSAHIDDFKTYYDELPFGDKPQNGQRYYYENNFFTYSDAITLYCMMRKYRPGKIVEIGSGFSSALILDTNDLFFNGSTPLTFIDPNPERLKSLLRSNEKVTIIEKKIQETDTGIFKELDAGDFLLIDTSHVTKSGSDVNHIYFNILPVLKKGVYVHIHDIFYPFEYPYKWVVEERRSWNEIYLLRALLTDSDAFKAVYFNSFAEEQFKDRFQNEMPLFLERKDNVCGGIWLKRIK